MTRGGRGGVEFSLSDLSESIHERIENKKDMIIAITGARGDGKSTLAYKLAHKIKLKFNPKKDIAYSIKEVLDWYAKYKNRTLIFDEAIAVHNREFFAKIQRQLIKVLNMYRDSCNVLVLCIPNFGNLDTQLRQLVRARIHVLRRGKAVVFYASLGAFNKDIWETDYNAKIESLYSSRGKQIPYKRFKTFKGYISFGDLHPSQRIVYETIKEDKRNVVYSEQNKEELDKNDIDGRLALLHINGDKKEVVAQMRMVAKLQGITYDAQRKRVVRRAELLNVAPPPSP